MCDYLMVDEVCECVGLMGVVELLMLLKLFGYV